MIRDTSKTTLQEVCRGSERPQNDVEDKMVRSLQTSDECNDKFRSNKTLILKGNTHYIYLYCGIQT